MVGGAAMFAAMVMNHQRAMVGVRANNPLLTRSLRDRVFS